MLYTKEIKDVLSVYLWEPNQIPLALIMIDYQYHLLGYNAV
jgi:hypothetical protein